MPWRVDAESASCVAAPHSGGEEQAWPIGLDGVLRMSEGMYGLPQGVRGEWVDDTTFVLEYDNIGKAPAKKTTRQARNKGDSASAGGTRANAKPKD